MATLFRGVVRGASAHGACGGVFDVAGCDSAFVDALPFGSRLNVRAVMLLMC